MSEPSTDEREALVDVGYRAWCEARKGKPLSPGEYEALYSRIEIGWVGKITDAILAARPAVDVEGIAKVLEGHEITFIECALSAGFKCSCGYTSGYGWTRVGVRGVALRHQSGAVVAYFAGESRG